MKRSRWIGAFASVTWLFGAAAFGQTAASSRIGTLEDPDYSERARQDREIVYFLKPPETHAFELYHDVTIKDVGRSTYINVVRAGSKVANPSALNLDTGEPLTMPVVFRVITPPPPVAVTEQSNTVAPVESLTRAHVAVPVAFADESPVIEENVSTDALADGAAGSVQVSTASNTCAPIAVSALVGIVPE